MTYINRKAHYVYSKEFLKNKPQFGILTAVRGKNAEFYVYIYKELLARQRRRKFPFSSHLLEWKN